jgi:hypothetical protein
MKVHNKARQRFLQRWSSLNWNSPFNLLPHGWSGAIVFFVGLFFLIQALFVGPNSPGGYDVMGPRPRPLFYLFVIACAINALAGMSITKKAPQVFHMPFYLGGATQLSLTWFAFRFSLESSRHYNLVGSLLDKTFGSVLLVVNLLFLYLSISPDKNKTPFLLKLPLLFGALSFGLTCFYPFQMAWFGHEWFSCVLDIYPYQKAGFVSYVYVPTLWASATIFFGLTLFIRKIIPIGVTAAVFFLLIAGVLIPTVLTQEVHISDVSTQQLILLCTEQEDDGSWLAHSAKLLDTSSLARSVLATLGVSLRTPPTY